jgi:hypothetical protein
MASNPRTQTLATRIDYGLADLAPDQLFEWLPYVIRSRDQGILRSLMIGLTSQHNWVVTKLRELGRLRDPMKAGAFTPEDEELWAQYEALMELRERTDAEEAILQQQVLPRIVGDLTKAAFERAALNALAGSSGEVITAKHPIPVLRRLIATAVPRNAIRGSASSLTAIAKILGYVDFKVLELWSRYSPRDPEYPGSDVNAEDFAYEPVDYPYWPLVGRYDGEVLSEVPRLSAGSVITTVSELFQQPVPSANYTPFVLDDGPSYSVTFSCHPDAAHNQAFHRINGRQPFGGFTERVNHLLRPGLYPLTGGLPGERAGVTILALEDSSVAYRFEANTPGTHGNLVIMEITLGATLDIQLVSISGPMSEIKFKSSLFDLKVAFDLQQFHTRYHPIPVQISDEDSEMDGDVSRTAPDYPVTGSLDGTPVIADPDQHFEVDWIRHDQENAQQQALAKTLTPLTRTLRDVEAGWSHQDQVKYAPVLALSEVNLDDGFGGLWRLKITETGSLSWVLVLAYTEGESYTEGQFVSSAGSMFLVRQPFIAPATPPITGTWSAVPYQDYGNAVPATWDADTTYAEGDLAYYLGYVYTALINDPDGPPSNVWEEVGTDDVTTVIQQDADDGDFYTWGILTTGIFTPIPVTTSPLDSPRDTLVRPAGDFNGFVFLRNGFLTASFQAPEQVLESLHPDGTEDESILTPELALVVENPIAAIIPYVSEDAVSTDQPDPRLSFQTGPEDEIQVIPTHDDHSLTHVAFPFHSNDALGVDWVAREEDWGFWDGAFRGRDPRLRTAGVEPGIIEPVPTGYWTAGYPVYFMQRHGTFIYRARHGRDPLKAHYLRNSVDLTEGAELVSEGLLLDELPDGFAAQSGDGTLEPAATVDGDVEIENEGFFSSDQVSPDYDWLLPYRRWQMASLPWGGRFESWTTVSTSHFITPRNDSGDGAPNIGVDEDTGELIFCPVGQQILVAPTGESEVLVTVLGSGFDGNGRPFIEVDVAPPSADLTGRLWWKTLEFVTPEADQTGELRTTHPRAAEIEFRVYRVPEDGSSSVLQYSSTSDWQVNSVYEITLGYYSSELDVWVSALDWSAESFVEVELDTVLPRWDGFSGILTMTGGDRDAIELTILEPGLHWTDAEDSGIAGEFTPDGEWRGGLWPDNSSVYEPTRVLISRAPDNALAGWSSRTGLYSDQFVTLTRPEQAMGGWTGLTGEYFVTITGSAERSEHVTATWNALPGDYDADIAAIWDMSGLGGGDGDPVEDVPDSSGNGNDLESLGSPVLRLNIRNGLNAIEFDGPGSMLLRPAQNLFVEGSWDIADTSFAIVMVLKKTDAGEQALIRWGEETGDSYLKAYFRSAANAILWQTAPGEFLEDTNDPSENDDEWMVLSFVRNGTSVTVRENGLEIAASTTSAVFPDDITADFLLCPNFRGLLGEVHVYKRFNDMVAIETELANKWGIRRGLFDDQPDAIVKESRAVARWAGLGTGEYTESVSSAGMRLERARAAWASRTGEYAALVIQDLTAGEHSSANWSNRGTGFYQDTPRGATERTFAGWRNRTGEYGDLGMLLWYDASTLTGSNNDRIATLPNLARDGDMDLSQSDVATRPRLKVAVRNGLNGLFFDSAPSATVHTELLRWNGMVPWSAEQSAAGFAIALVVNPEVENPPFGYSSILKIFFGTGGSVLTVGRTTAVDPEDPQAYLTLPPSTVLFSEQPTGHWSLWYITVNEDLEYEFWINGEIVDSGTLSAPITGSYLTNISIGYGIGGHIGEVRFYDRGTNTAETIATIEELRIKWALRGGAFGEQYLEKAVLEHAMAGWRSQVGEYLAFFSTVDTKTERVLADWGVLGAEYEPELEYAERSQADWRVVDAVYDLAQPLTMGAPDRSQADWELAGPGDYEFRIADILDLEGHWDAHASFSATANGTAISSWVDTVASATLTQGTGLNQPIVVSNATYNGRTVVRFDGSNDVLSLATNDFDLTSDQTIVLVFRFTVNQNGRILGTYDGTNGWYVGIYGSIYDSTQAGSVHYMSSTRGANTVGNGMTGFSTPHHGGWNIVTITREAGVSTVRVNGVVQVSTISGHGNAATTGTFYIGGSSSFFAGDLAEVMLISRAVPDEESEALEVFLANKWGIELREAVPDAIPVTSGLTTWYDFRQEPIQAAYATLADRSGNGVNLAQGTGSLQPAASYGVFDYTLAGYAPDDTRIAATGLSNTILPSTGFTISILMSTDGPANFYYGFGFGVAGNTKNIRIGHLSTGKLIASLNDLRAESTTILTAGRWYHVVLIYGGGNWDDGTTGAKVYVDGVLSTMTYAGSGSNAWVPDASGNALALFGDYSGNTWRGRIGEVATWNRVLTDTEINLLSLYAKSKWAMRGLQVDALAFVPIVEDIQYGLQVDAMSFVPIVETLRESSIAVQALGTVIAASEDSEESIAVQALGTVIGAQNAVDDTLSLEGFQPVIILDETYPVPSTESLATVIASITAPVLNLDGPALSGSDDTALTTWTDVSGNARHATHLNLYSEIAPSLRTSVQNGLNAVQWKGVSKCFLAISSQDLFTTWGVTDRYTAYFVFSKTALHNGPAAVFNAASRQVSLYPYYTGSVTYADFGNTGSGGRLTTTTPLQSGWQVFTVCSDGEMLSLFRNHVLNNSAANSTAMAAGTSTFWVGTDASSAGVSGNFSGYIGDIIIFNTAHSHTTRTRMISALMNRWAIT